MHITRYATVLLYLLSASALANAPSSGSIPDWAKDFLQSWYAAYNKGDAAAVASFFDTDAWLVSAGPAGTTNINGIETTYAGTAEIGRHSIEGLLARNFATTQYTCSGSYDGVQQLGTLAVGWGHESCLKQPKNSRTTERTHEHWLRVFALQMSGRWVITRETFETVHASKP
jgi:ketosteroid isomerase-like protein